MRMTRLVGSLMLSGSICCVGAGRAATGGKASPSIRPGSLSPCAFATAEIKNVLGMDIKQAQAADVHFPGGRDVGCIYTFPDTQLVLSVRQTWGKPSSASAVSAHDGDGASAGGHGVTSTLRAIQGDVDGAAWKVSSGDDSDVTLTYTRANGNVHTTVSVHGEPLDVATMQQKLLALRRVP